MGSHESMIIERYMPQVEKWARKFVRKKNGGCMDNAEDYIQCAYLALTDFVKQHKDITPANMGLLWFHVKREMYGYIHQMLPMYVPLNDFMSKFYEVENSVHSLEGMVEKVGDKFSEWESSATSAFLGARSGVATEERIDFHDTVSKLPQRQKEIVRLYSLGYTLQEISDVMQRPYTGVYEDLSRIRSILKQKAYPDFLERPSPNKTESNVMAAFVDSRSTAFE